MNSKKSLGRKHVFRFFSDSSKQNGLKSAKKNSLLAVLFLEKKSTINY